jgi:predicted metallopeptidase
VITAKISEEDYQKVLEEAARQELAKKTFDELTKDEKIKLALEELAAIVMGGQDGEEYYNSVKFIKNVLESLRTPDELAQGITQHPRDAL